MDEDERVRFPQVSKEKKHLLEIFKFLLWNGLDTELFIDMVSRALGFVAGFSVELDLENEGLGFPFWGQGKVGVDPLEKSIGWFLNDVFLPFFLPSFLLSFQRI